jgi:hypothetical protein
MLKKEHTNAHPTKDELIDFGPRVCGLRQPRLLPKQISEGVSQALIDALRNITNRAAYLSAVLEDGDQEEVLLALRRITAALGGALKLAEQIEATGT